MATWIKVLVPRLDRGTEAKGTLKLISESMRCVPCSVGPEKQKGTQPIVFGTILAEISLDSVTRDFA